MKDEEKEPAPNQHERCPECGGRLEMGYGLAGGGFGAYEYCPRCEIIVNKWQEGPDE